MKAPDQERRLRGMIQTFTASIQYAALICVSEYARANYCDENLSWSMERLKRPLISDFFNFVAASHASLRQRGISPLIAENEAFGMQMEQTRVSVPVMVDEVPREQSLLLRKALMELRNTLGHKLYQANWAQLVKQYLPHLLAFLRAMEWCTRYPLLRIVDNDRMVRLMGANTPFKSEPIPEAAHEELARAHQKGEFSGLLLADPTLTRFLNLYPLILMAPCQECEAQPLSGLTEEVFLFNGDEGKYLVYLGVRHSRNTEHLRDAIDALYERKKIQPPVISVNRITLPELRMRAKWQSEQLLAANISARRYLPQLYHQRPEMEAALRAFMYSNRAGFCLLGEAGIGKTSLLCHKAEEWSGRGTSGDDAEETAGQIVLLYQGKGLFASGNLEERIMKDLNLEGSFQELLNRLRPTGRRLIIIVDGINEDVEPHVTLQAMCQFIMRYAGAATQKTRDVPPLQVVFSFRSAFYDKTLQVLGYAGDGDEMRDLLPADVFFTHEVNQQGQKKQTYRFVLESMGEVEAEVVYEAYRSFESVSDEATGKARSFRPLTSFSGLSLPTRQLITHPWYLRMVMETFDGRQVPDSLWVGKLLEEFCQKKIYGKTEAQHKLFEDRAKFVDELVRLMRRQHTDIIKRGDPLLSPEMHREIDERQTPLSAYLQLLDEGVLMEMSESETIGGITRARYLIRFAFDPLFEYLLSQDILLKVGDGGKLTGGRLALLLKEGKEFDHLTGAVEFLLIDAAQQRNFALITDTLNAAEVWLPTFVRVLETLEGMNKVIFEALLDFLVVYGKSEKSIGVLWNASGEFGKKQRLRPMLACTERAANICRGLMAQAGSESRHTELRNTLSLILINEGAALAGLGRLDKALDSYNETIAIQRSLIKEQSQSALLLAITLGSKGEVLSRTGQLDEALDCCNKAVGIYGELAAQGQFDMGEQLAEALNSKGLVLIKLLRSNEAIVAFAGAIGIYKAWIIEGRSELAKNLAMPLMNTGLALRNMGDFAQAVDSYNAAINIYRVLIKEQGHTELANDLALALMNNGSALFESGKLEQAVDSYDEAINIYKMLVQEQGRTELANRLAMTLGSKGEVLRKTAGRIFGALDCCNEAVEIYKALITHGRTELIDALSMTLINRGLVVEDIGNLREAVTSYNEAINLWVQLVGAGMTHLTPNLLKGLRTRLYVWVKVKQWDKTAADVQQVLIYTLPFLQTNSSPGPVFQEWLCFLRVLRSLTSEESAQLYIALGGLAETVRTLVVGSDNS